VFDIITGRFGIIAQLGIDGISYTKAPDSIPGGIYGCHFKTPARLPGIFQNHRNCQWLTGRDAIRNDYLQTAVTTIGFKSAVTVRAQSFLGRTGAAVGRAAGRHSFGCDERRQENDRHKDKQADTCKNTLRHWTSPPGLILDDDKKLSDYTKNIYLIGILQVLLAPKFDKINHRRFSLPWEQ
jgi:hypothetical protein